MPAGCDFICKNDECEQHGNGFAITGPWPMGEIELVISSLSKSLVIKPENQAILDKIVEQKNNGRECACIIYPNNDRIKKVAHRVQLWSPDAKCIWDYDIPLDEDNKDVTEDIKDASLPILCPKTNGELLSFNEVTKDGIECPYCGGKLEQSRWFTNE